MLKMVNRRVNVARSAGFQPALPIKVAPHSKVSGLAGLVGALLPSSGVSRAGEAVQGRSRMGIVTYALGIHQKNKWAGRHAGLSPALAILEEAHSFGAGGIQVDLSQADTPHVTEFRRRLEEHAMYFEASISPPRDADDIARFENDV